MTIRMLAAYPYGRHTIPAGAVVSVFDAATEAGLITAKLALAASGVADTWAVPVDVPTVPTEVSALKVVSTGLTPAAQGVGAGVLCRTSAGMVVMSSADAQAWSSVSGDGATIARTEIAAATPAIAVAAGAAVNDTALAALIATPSGVASVAVSTPICAWGIVQTFPSRDSITHFLIPQIAQNAANASQQWAYLVLTVQEESSAGAVLATARFSIPAHRTPLSNLIFALSAPIDPAQSASGRYFVWVEAYSATNTRVPCGYCFGGVPSENAVLGTGQYKTSSAPTVWVAGVAASARDQMLFVPQTAARQAAPIAAATAPVIVLPPIWAVVGREVNVYFDGLIRGNYQALDWDVTCAIGAQQRERWTAVPDAPGSQAITVSALHPSTADVVATASSTVTIAAAAAAFTAQLLVIGDSTTAGGTTTGELVVLDAADSAVSLTLIGTQGSAPNLHEGRAGWNAATFTTSGSPFWIGGTVDMPAYLAANGGTGITHCVIALGINDVFNAATDAALTTSINTYMTGVARMIQGLRAHSATIKIGIALPIPPSFSQDSFGDNYGAGQTRARYRRNWHGLVREIHRAVTTAAVSNISLLPYSCSLATEANMATATVAVNSRNSATVVRQSNGVHPAASGYLQLADVVWSWLKCNP